MYLQFAWRKDEKSETVTAIMMRPDTKPAPDVVVKSIRCNCTTSQCKTFACKCKKNSRPCTEFCNCVNTTCQNHLDDSSHEDDSESEDF